MAFDLVATLKLNDQFSNKLKSVFAQMDKVKSQVSQAAKGSRDLGEKLSAASTKMSTALGKVETKTVELPKKFDSLGKMASQSLENAAKGADVLGTSTVKAGSLSQASLNKLSQHASKMESSFSKVGSTSSKSIGLIGKSGESMRKVLTNASDATKRKIESIGRVTEPLRSKFSQASDKIRNSLNKAIPGDSLKSKLTGLGRSVGGLPSKFAQATNRIRSSLKSGIETPAISAKGAIVGIATAITGSLGAVNLFEAGMNRLSTLENSKLSLGVMMGDAKEASVFMDEVLAFAKKTPFAFPDLAESARNLYAFGMDKAKVIPTLKAIGDAAAATGKGQEGLNQVTDAFGAMQIAGKVSMEEINRLQSGGVPALKILANQSGMSAAAMKKSISDGALESDKAIQQLVEGMQKGTQGIAGETKSMVGIMEKSKKTWTGTVDSMKSAISSTMATLLEPAKPKLQAAMTWFGKTFSKIPDMAKQFAPLIKVIGVFVASVTGIFAVIGAFAAMSGALTFLLGPIGLIALGVTALVTGFALAYKHIKPFREGVEGMVGSIKKLYGGMKAMFSIFSGDNGSAIDILKSLGFTEEQYNGMVEFKNKVFGVFDNIKSGASQFSEYLSAKWTEMAPGMEMLAEAFSIGKEVLVSVFTTLWAVLQPIFGALKNALMIVADVVVIAWNNIIAPIIQTTMKIFQTLWAIVGPILKLLGSAIGLAFEVLKVAWDTIIKPVTKFLTNEFKKALGDINPALDLLKTGFDAVGGVIEKVAGWFDSFKSALSKFKVPNWLSRLGGGGTVKFENSGGSEKKGEGRYNGIKYVPRDNTPYRLHRGERVLTARENKEHNKGGNGRSFVINMNGTVIREEADVDRLAEKMVRKFIAAGEGGA